MATKKPKARKPAAKKSGSTAAKRTVAARARKPAGTPSSRRKPSAAASPMPQADWSFTRMLADIFGMR